MFELLMIDCIYKVGEIICGEVSRPSQPNGVISIVVSLPNHTFDWAGSVLQAVYQYLRIFFFSPELTTAFLESVERRE